MAASTETALPLTCIMRARRVLSHPELLGRQDDNALACPLGIWLNSKEVKDLSRDHEEYAYLVDRLQEAHFSMHEVVARIRELASEGHLSLAQQCYANELLKHANGTLAHLNTLVRWDNQYRLAKLQYALRVKYGQPGRNDRMSNTFACTSF
jgi:hypothetical protein